MSTITIEFERLENHFRYSWSSSQDHEERPTLEVDHGEWVTAAAEDWPPDAELAALLREWACKLMNQAGEVYKSYRVVQLNSGVPGVERQDGRIAGFTSDKTANEAMNYLKDGTLKETDFFWKKEWILPAVSRRSMLSGQRFWRKNGASLIGSFSLSQKP